MAAGSGSGDGGAVVREEEMVESRGGRETQRLNGTVLYEVQTKQQTFCSCVHCTPTLSSAASLFV